MATITSTSVNACSARGRAGQTAPVRAHAELDFAAIITKTSFSFAYGRQAGLAEQAKTVKSMHDSVDIGARMLPASGVRREGVGLLGMEIYGRWQIGH